MSQNATVVVTPVTLVSIDLEFSDSSTSKTIFEGETAQAKAIGKYNNDSTADITDTVIWTVSDSNNAKINSSGNIYDTLPSNQNIDIQNYNGINPDSIPLTINQISVVTISISPGSTDNTNRTEISNQASSLFSLNCNYNNGSTGVPCEGKWSLSDTEGKALVTEQGGELRPYGSTGDIDLSATLFGKISKVYLKGKEKSVTSIQLKFSDSSTSKTIIEGQTAQVLATATYDDDSTADITNAVTWIINDEDNANISDAGYIDNTAPSNQEISIQNFSGIDANVIDLTINEKTVSSIEVTPGNPTLVEGTQIKLIVFAYFDNNEIISSDVDSIFASNITWSSGEVGVASVYGDDSSETITAMKGTITGESIGSTTISASYGDKTGNTTVNVIEATLNSISIETLSLENYHDFPIVIDLTKPLPIGVGSNGIEPLLKVIAHFEGGDQQDITNDPSITWSDSGKGNISVYCLNGNADCRLQVEENSGSETIYVNYAKGAVIANDSIDLSTGNKIISKIIFYFDFSSMITGQEIVIIDSNSDIIQKVQLTYSDGTKIDITTFNEASGHDLSFSDPDVTSASFDLVFYLDFSVNTGDSIESIENGTIKAHNTTYGESEIKATMTAENIETFYMKMLTATDNVLVTLEPVIGIGNVFHDKTRTDPSEFTFNVPETASYTFTFIPEETTQIILDTNINTTGHDMGVDSCILNIEHPWLRVDLTATQAAHILDHDIHNNSAANVDFTLSVEKTSEVTETFECPSCTPCMEGCAASETLSPTIDDCEYYYCVEDDYVTPITCWEDRDHGW